ncbi:MAG: bifunctional nicotinamidase/pyrazinamidase [Spirochaetota bacterium]
MSNSALLVIDVQNDFCPGGALAVDEGDQVVPVINKIAPLFDVVVATRDWHPQAHVSFASAHEGHDVGEAIEVDGLEQVLWPDHCVQGTKGAAFHPDLDLRPINLILHKGTSKGLDSYSGFLETDRRTATGLESYLKGLDVSEVTVCGLATDYCVFFTAMDAVNAGFKTRVVTDAARGIDQPEGHLNETLDDMKNAGVSLVTSASILGGAASRQRR